MITKTNNSIIIPVHSFVDLVTNSSSETFISATAKTVETAQNLINCLLKIAGSGKTYSDLFKIDLVREVEYHGLTNSEYLSKGLKEHGTFVGTDEEVNKFEKDNENFTSEIYGNNNENLGYSYSLRIIPLTDDLEAKKVEELISGIYRSYNNETYYS